MSRHNQFTQFLTFQTMPSLIEGLDKADDEASEMLWVEEVERRYQSYREGKIKAVPGDEAMQRARQRLNGNNVKYHAVSESSIPI